MCDSTKHNGLITVAYIFFQMRVGFVGYRDHVDGPERIVSIDLTENTSAVMSFMNSVRATGGGDECEDIFGGLERVVRLGWRNPNRILIHIGDAPQHGSRFFTNILHFYMHQPRHRLAIKLHHPLVFT